MGPVLESQLFSGFLIEWMIEHPTKSNSKNLKKLDFWYFLLDFCWIIGFD
jgi:hypothetical protein